MPTIEITLPCPVRSTFRVEQVRGMFDLPDGPIEERFRVELPELSSRPWQIGLICGPSGSGKTTIARRLFGDALARPPQWPDDAAVIDAFAPLPVSDAVMLLTAVGFSSPPGWLKPYRVLSNGERFRCDLARALAQTERPESIVVFDEFTSVVDRTVAKVCSAAVAKAIRGGRVRRRFAAVTCHDDVIDWLAPDWVLDMAAREFSWRRLRRPPIRLELARCARDLWPVFARHHYLSGSLNPSARCYAAFWDGRPTTFCATLHNAGKHRQRRITRLVTLPDFQGIGIGMAVAEAVAALETDEGVVVSLVTSHPAVIARARRGPQWRIRSFKPFGSRHCGLGVRGSLGRAVASMVYVGPPLRRDLRADIADARFMPCAARGCGKRPSALGRTRTAGRLLGSADASSETVQPGERAAASARGDRRADARGQREGAERTGISPPQE